MKTINLTKGKTAIVDDDDYEILSKYNWYAFQNSCNHWYAARRERGTKKFVVMHRFIMNAPQELQVDHINNDGLDNRKENMRLCTGTQNRYNQKKRKDASAKYKGVYAKRKKFAARIKYNGKVCNLGVFLTQEDAARAYDKKAAEFYGDFARLNFSEEII